MRVARDEYTLKVMAVWPALYVAPSAEALMAAMPGAARKAAAAAQTRVRISLIVCLLSGPGRQKSCLAADLLVGKSPRQCIKTSSPQWGGNPRLVR